MRPPRPNGLLKSNRRDPRPKRMRHGGPAVRRDPDVCTGPPPAGTLGRQSRVLGAGRGGRPRPPRGPEDRGADLQSRPWASLLVRVRGPPPYDSCPRGLGRSMSTPLRLSGPSTCRPKGERWGAVGFFFLLGRVTRTGRMNNLEDPDLFGFPWIPSVSTPSLPGVKKLSKRGFWRPTT